jgi:single-strand DNA-binding protein
MLQGRLTRDPELKYTQSNVAYMEVTVAWSEKYKEVEKKCFLRCKAWRGTAELIGKYFQKGKEIVVEGQMETEEWTGQDGKPQSRTICLVDKVHFCGSKSGDSQQGASGGRLAPGQAYGPADADGFMAIPDGVEDEGLPFN